MLSTLFSIFFFFNDTATTEIYTLSLHDALPIWVRSGPHRVLREHVRRAPHPQSSTVQHVGIDQDRKSTRLNSSHSQISYAVFCLKKKKKTQETSNATTYLYTLIAQWRHARSNI